ncbi:hypothetical protein CY35_14G040800 [Sphagnum magellanicum]|nr:hypothetical protein CY35_14G040800 [Sphagnum magellanicum]
MVRFKCCASKSCWCSACSLTLPWNNGVKAMQNLATVGFTKNLLGNQQLGPRGIFEIQGRAVIVFVCSNNVM